MDDFEKWEEEMNALAGDFIGRYWRYDYHTGRFYNAFDEDITDWWLNGGE